MGQVGLSQKEARKRLSYYGENKIPKGKRRGDWEILQEQFKSPLIYVLVGAMAITGFLLHDIKDTIIIGIAVGFNTILGFFQERKANRAMEALASVLTPKARVKRDGRWQEVEAKLVVPGDLIRLGLGDKVPADGRVVNSDYLSVNEAVLTGESASVTKKRGDKIFMGTVVVGGGGEAEIELTGGKTEFGRIALSLEITREPETPLQQQINQLAKILAWIVAIVCLLIAGVGLVSGWGMKEIFPTAVALAVAAIPEGLSVALTVILAIGMQRILKRKALVRKMVAAETLGGVSMICCDKTGTLTEGKMRVVDFVTKDESLLRRAAVWGNNLIDPLEIAMKEWAGIDESTEPKRLVSIPFDPANKYKASLHPGLLLVSGAPEVIVNKCRIGTKRLKEVLARIEKEAKKGFRLIGFAYKKTNKINLEGLTWLGLLIFEDPVRQGVKEVLDQARRAGIKIKMITGDYPATALEVGRQLGFKEEDVYSRILPEEKLKIVEELQNEGEVVAMTGDGVNDAPALKKANVGIVVNEASDVAKETADMVLLDNNFETILAAIAEGRLIRDNLKKVALYLLADSFGEILIVVLSLVFRVPLAITAGMILWINLVSDGFPGLALTVEPAESNLLKRQPNRRKNWLIDGEVSLLIGLISITSALTGFSAFWYYWHHPAYGLEHARTVAFTLLGLNSLIYVWSARSLSQPMWRVKWDKNKYLVLGVGLGLMLQLSAIYTPFGRNLLDTVGLNLSEWLIIGAGSLLMIVIVEGVKWAYNRKI